MPAHAPSQTGWTTGRENPLPHPASPPPRRRRRPRGARGVAPPTSIAAPAQVIADQQARGTSAWARQGSNLRPLACKAATERGHALSRHAPRALLVRGDPPSSGGVATATATDPPSRDAPTLRRSDASNGPACRRARWGADRREAGPRPVRGGTGPARSAWRVRRVRRHKSLGNRHVTIDRTPVKISSHSPG
jgi:hypothetical protein